MASALSMILSNSACGWAPFRKTPLIKNPGVPLTPTLLPSCKSASILALTFPLVRQDWNDLSFSPKTRAWAFAPTRYSL
jgi:hypothetical protein